MLYAPAPPPLAAIESKIVNYLERHHFSFPQLPGLEVMNTQIAPEPAGPLAGVTPIALALAGTIVVDPQIAHEPVGQVVPILLHETLHETQTGGAFDYATLTPDEQVATEQATETTTRDLLPGLLRASFPAFRWSAWPGMPTAYPGLVKRERVASARACRCGWTSAAARSWRAKVFLTPAAARAVIR